jgi:hypothetical protein
MIYENENKIKKAKKYYKLGLTSDNEKDKKKNNNKLIELKLNNKK